MKLIMKEVFKNKNLIYVIISLIILIGIISIVVLKLDFSLIYKENTRIDLYLGKRYNINEIKQLAKESFGEQEMIIQGIERFGDSVAITVEEASEEQIKNFETKVKEKYGISTEETILQTNIIPHFRGRDILKPYIIPMIIITVAILAYVGIRYTKLGIFNTVFTLLFRLIVSEAVLLSIIAIARLPIGIYTVPVAIIVYTAVTMFTIVRYQNEIDKKDMPTDRTV